MTMSETKSETYGGRPRPEWVVLRESEDLGRVTYRLIDVAKSGVTAVGIRCSGCPTVDVAASTPLTDGACEFTVGPAEPRRQPQLTVTWEVGGGYSARWSAPLP